MVLNHIAAILLFAGPLFYFGLWIAVDPARLASLVELLGQKIVPTERADISRKIRAGVRFAGVLLVLFAIVI